MNVSLTPELEEFVASKVRSGLFRSNSEVVRQALRLLMERESMLQARLLEIRAEVAEGLEQARHGELIPAVEVQAKLESREKANSG